MLVVKVPQIYNTLYQSRKISSRTGIVRSHHHQHINTKLINEKGVGLGVEVNGRQRARYHKTIKKLLNKKGLKFFALFA